MRKTTLLSGAALGLIVALGLGAAAQAQDLGVKWKGAPEFSNDDVKFKVRGRVYMDYVAQDVDRETGTDYDTSNTRLRTARLGVEGSWNANWAYKAEVTLNQGAAQWEDLVLEYKPNDNTSLMIGNFRSVSLENINSSRYITFMERGAFNDFIDAGRVMTVAAKMNGENWTLAGGAHGDSVNNTDVNSGTAEGDEQLAWFARGTFAPIMTDSTNLHLGLWARKRDLNDQAARYRVRNNSNVGDRFTQTGSGATQLIESDTQIGAEAALVWNAFSLQGEYARLDAERVGAADAEANGYYVYGSFFLTGERRFYEPKKGEFGRTKILNPTNAGGMGAWEVGLRYDNVDLTDFHSGSNTQAGEYSAVTAGLNWYPFTYVRFMANYTKAENDSPTVGQDVDVDTLQFRAQFDF
ncbi:MAG TPA: porin [Caulobacteraceae bacterium]|nr:porin [Caulobacteraceae bacterium]